MDKYALERGIKRIISVICLLFIISFFIFYWMNAVLGSGFSPYPFTAGVVLFCFMIAGFRFLIWRKHDEHYEGHLRLGKIFTIIGLGVVILNSIAAIYLGIVTSIVNLPGSPDFVFGTGLLFLVMGVVAIYFWNELTTV